jgi:hypothetical protein
MQEFKELIIKRPRVGNTPTLDLQGKWLELIGFTQGTSVHIVYTDNCLTLTTFNIANINDTPNILCVTTKLVRKRPRTYLTLDWWLLKKYGFHVGDRVGLTLIPNMIQITKINPSTTDEI